MPSTGSIKVARIFGIRIGVDVSWFLVLFFFIFLLSGSFKDALDNESDTAAYVTAVASALAFFGSLILHELGHALAARRVGIGISGIDLWFFGGVAKMSRDSNTPGEELKVAIAGPIVTALIIGACFGGGILAAGSWDAFVDAAAVRDGADVTPTVLLLSFIASMNVLLLAFNLIPAFPLDGGRVVRAIAWKATGDRLKATQFAAALGQGFAYLMMGVGVAQLIGVVDWLGGALSGIWAIVLGYFLLSAARGAVGQTVLSERLGAVTVEDIMEREPVAIPADASVLQAQEEYFFRYRYPWFPVVNASGRYVGVVTLERIDGAVTTGDGSATVGTIMDAEEGERLVVEDTPLESLLGHEALRQFGVLMAVDDEGRLRGIVTLDQVRQALQSAVTSAGSR